MRGTPIERGSGWRRPGARRGRRRHDRWRVATVLVVFVVLAATSLTLAHLVGESARREAEVRFRRTAGQVAGGVQNALAADVDRLQSAGAYLATAPDSSRASFAAFVRANRLAQDLPWLEGLLFVEKVDDADLPAFVARKRAVDPTFAITPARPLPPGTPHHVITQYEPGRTTWSVPIGFDSSALDLSPVLSSLAEGEGRVVAAAVPEDDEFARRAAQLDPVVARPVELDVDIWLGIPVVEPAPAGGGPGRYRGVLVAPVGRLAGLLDGTSGDARGDLAVQLAVDLTAGDGSVRPAGVGDELTGTDMRREEVAFETAGLSWRAVLSGPAGDGGNGGLALVVGLLLSTAAAGVVHVRLRSVGEMAERVRLQHDIIDSVDNAMVVLDGEGGIVAANPAWSRLCFLPRARRQSDRPSYLEALGGMARAGADELGAALGGVLAGARAIDEIDVLCVGGDGLARWLAVRATPLRSAGGGAVVVHTDITGRKRTQQRYEREARVDRLTGLLNRAALDHGLDAVLARGAQRGEPAVALLFVDLDGFKGINDSYGHAAGDEVLRILGGRLGTVVRPEDLVGRLGGDEFVIVLTSAPHPDIALDTAARVVDVVAQPLAVGEHVLAVGASVGVALAAPGEGRVELLARADAAMYRAKRAGGGPMVAPAP